jgi:N-acetylglucosamine kinase-like BadF-type ATPase
MILVADSGSTKTEWKTLKEGIPGESVFTTGINPYFLSGDDIFLLLAKELDIYAGKKFSKVYFYGTGCNNVTKENIVRGAIEKYLSPDEIFVGSDLLGAARSLCQNDRGIACIMGTGSNSCYYNGSVIESNVSPLGYILGDEGGGAVIGKKLISGVLKKQVPKGVIDSFFETYKLTPTEILENVYMKPFPNRFLGQFAQFISSNIEVPELQEIIISSFNDFIKRNVLQYPEAKKLPIHFTGSIAWHFRPFLEGSLKSHRLTPGIITLTPMSQLINYHICNL